MQKSGKIPETALWKRASLGSPHLGLGAIQREVIWALWAGNPLPEWNIISLVVAKTNRSASSVRRAIRTLHAGGWLERTDA